MINTSNVLKNLSAEQIHDWVSIMKQVEQSKWNTCITNINKCMLMLTNVLWMRIIHIFEPVLYISMYVVISNISSNSEANASEFLEKLAKMFIGVDYYYYLDVYSLLLF